jgi:hypothetical protein
MKIEGSVALVTGANRGIGAGHRLAGETSLPLAALAADGFLMFPRDLAPRLHDFMVDPCRRAGFEPLIRSESFHTGWERRSSARPQSSQSCFHFGPSARIVLPDFAQREP